MQSAQNVGRRWYSRICNFSYQILFAAHIRH
jgi:hypothetical protein